MKSAIIYALIPLVAGHGAIIKATAPGGGSGMALGVDPDTPRDTTRRDPGQLDSTRFKGDAADTVGETVGAGTNDIDAGTKAIMTMTGDMLPQVAAGGEIQMTVHQVNGDGAGPYSCMINTDATAAEWTDIQVTQNVPGEAGRNRDGATTDFPLNAEIPAGTTCTGTVAGQENVCMVRCQNPARAGPFGGVVPVQMAGANATTPNTPAAARRNLAMAMKRDLQLLKKMVKRASTLEEDAEELDMPEEDLAQLREDGEEI
ncbi:putative mas3 protein [Diaporthe ampelina]|uniref:Putative mas3 protein n=1 Tax=Diaporthe ampelina TaxID=1214573 RepID=A0A0G2FCR9_9PEZI|nr:putative mas3 protein [Diaporthe ampelina]